MLCSHVVFRQSVRRGWSRLISTTAAAETPRSRGPGRPRKTPTAPAKDEIEPPKHRGPGRPRKIDLIGDVSTTAVDGKAPNSRKPSRKKERSDASSVEADGSATGNVKGKPVVKKSKKPVGKRVSSPKRRLSPQKHHDLASFLEYAAKANLKKDTCVYRGNHYEYTVAETLKRYNFTLEKIGRANDLGIDLLGTWHLPEEPRELRVLIQCKASKPRPAFVRELEGAYAGAPAGWKKDGVMALLITRDRATPGVLKALGRSEKPMGFAQISEDGHAQQLVWNSAATRSHLTGMTSSTTYRGSAGRLSPSSPDPGRLAGVISLQWMGEQWPNPKTPLVNMQGLLTESEPATGCLVD